MLSDDRRDGWLRAAGVFFVAVAVALVGFLVLGWREFFYRGCVVDGGPDECRIQDRDTIIWLYDIGQVLLPATVLVLGALVARSVLRRQRDRHDR